MSAGTISLYAPGRTNAQREPWQTDALCAQTAPDAFTVDKGQSTTTAKAICAACTVRAQCLQYALDNNLTDSIYGGLTPKKRRQLKAATA